MDNIAEFVDERHKAWCIHCGNCLEAGDANRDHVPSKCLLLEPYPANLPVIPVCKACNEGFSPDEEYMATFLGCVLAGSTEPDRQTNAGVAAILRHSPGLREDSMAPEQRFSFSLATHESCGPRSPSVSIEWS